MASAHHLWSSYDPGSPASSQVGKLFSGSWGNNIYAVTNWAFVFRDKNFCACIRESRDELGFAMRVSGASAVVLLFMKLT